MDSVSLKTSTVKKQHAQAKTKTKGQAVTLKHLDRSSFHWVYCTVQFGANYQKQQQPRDIHVP